MSQQTVPKVSSWIRSLTYETGSVPVVSGFFLTTDVDTGIELVTPFGTCNASNAYITGPGGQYALYYPASGTGGLILAGLGFGSYAITKGSGISHLLSNLYVNDALYNGAAFPIGGSQSFTGSGSWTLDCSSAGAGSSWVVMKTRRPGRRSEYRYQLGSSAEVQAWVNSGDAGRHYWRHIRRKNR